MRFNRPAGKPAQSRYLVDNLFPLGYCAALIGGPESGKTSLAAAIALAVANGEPFARQPTTRGGVLWLAAGDSPLRPVTSHLENLPIYETHSRPPIDTDEGIEDLAAWVRKLSARLIVVDPLDSHAHITAWNAPVALARIKSLCYRTGAGALLLHTHRTNTDPYHEVMHYAAAVDMAIHLTTDDSNEPRLLYLRSTGRGRDVNFEICLTSNGRFEYDYAGQPKATSRPRRRSLDEQVLSAIAQSRAALSAKDVSDQLQRNPNSIRNSLARLLAAGRVYTSHHASGARHFRAEK